MPTATASLYAMQDTAHVMSKVDKLLGEVRTAGAGEGRRQGCCWPAPLQEMRALMVH
jgi:hypothetical protein